MRRGTHDTGEHLVPGAVAPAIELAVPDQPLLLRAVDHGAAVKLRISDEAAAGERRAGAIIHQGGKPVDVDTTHRRGLRHGPEFAGFAAEGRVGHVYVQVRQGAPEVSERDAVVAGRIALVVHVNAPVDDNVVRGEAEARHGGVVADLKIKGCAGGSICAGHEQQCVALRSELVGNLLVGDCVDGHLDLASRHAGVKDHHVRSEIRRRRANQTEHSKREQTTKGKAAWQMHSLGGMSCSAKIYKGDDGGSRVILRYGKDSQANGPLRECRSHQRLGVEPLLPDRQNVVTSWRPPFFY